MRKSTHPNNYTIWVDHKKAILLCADGEGKIVSEEMKSALGLRERFKGEVSQRTSLFGRTMTREKKERNRMEEHYHAFLKDVVSKLNKVNGILILGPGDARFELQSEIQKKKSLSQIWIENKAADKMNLMELKLALKEHFNLN